MRVVALIDGEHHPSVVKDGLGQLGAEHELVGVIFCGGSEKVSTAALDDSKASYGAEVIVSDSPKAALGSLLEKGGVEAVFDLADEPIVAQRDKLAYASIALANNVAFAGPGIDLQPPTFTEVASQCPKVAVIGTGKRTGKTAVAAHLARLLKACGQEPVIVSMGRGGPPIPQLLRGSKGVTTQNLLEMARAGSHAASDYIEDAVLAQVDTVGCRRLAGGLVGSPYITNVVEGTELACTLDPSLLILEGSGSSFPPVIADKTICITNALHAREQALGYLGPLRLMRSQLVLITGENLVNPDEMEEITAGIQEWVPGGLVVPCSLEAELTEPLPDGAVVAFFTTAEGVVPLEGVEPAFYSNSLARRRQLASDIKEAIAVGCNTFVMEIKAASIEMVAEAADAEGVAIRFVNNRPTSADTDIDQCLLNFVEEPA